MRERLPTLDALRGIAALYVVIHFVYIAVYGDTLHLWHLSITAKVNGQFVDFLKTPDPVNGTKNDAFIMN